MLPDHVEAQVPCLFYVKPQCLISGGGIQAVGPPTLVERTILKQKLIIDQDPFYPVCIGSDRDLAHGEVAFYLIHYLFVPQNRKFKVIQKRIFRRPELWRTY